MLEHHQNPPALPKRVVMLGASGFIAAALLERLGKNGAAVKAIGRGQIDLGLPDAGARLAAELQEGDALVFLSAVTPAAASMPLSPT